VTVRLADRAGVVARYGGLGRYVALLFNRAARELQLVRQYDDQVNILAKAPCEWQLNEPHELRLAVTGGTAVAFADGKAAPLFHADFDALPAGGIALLTDNGTTTFSDLAVTPA